MAVFSGRPMPTQFPVTFITSNTTNVPSYLGIIEATPTAPAAWTLPDLTNISEGSYLWIKNYSAFNIVLTPAPGDTIGGAGSYTIAPNYLLILFSDRTNTWKVWSYLPPIVVGGPGLSTDNAVVRWDGTSGSVIKNSNAILDNPGNLTLIGSLTSGSFGSFAGSLSAGGPVNITIGTNGYQIVGINALRQNGTNLMLGPCGVPTGTGDIVVGSGAAPVVGAANDNVIIGVSAALLLSTGASNVIVGRSSGGSITSGGNNTCLGAGADINSATGNFRTALGAGATNVADNSVQLGRATTDDVYVGRNLLVPNGNVNIVNPANVYQVAGTQALYLNGTNLVLGPGGIPTGTNNVFIGVGVATGVGAANSNTIAGAGAGAALTTGGTNSFYGAGAGNIIDTGSSNTCLGNAANVNSSIALFRTALGAGAVCTGDNKVQLGRDTLDNVAVGRHLLVPSGTIGATGSTVQINKASVTQTVSNTNPVVVVNNTGYITMFGALSDAAGAITATFTIDFTAVNSASVFQLQVTGYTGNWGTDGIPIAVVESISAGVATVAVFNASSLNPFNGTVTFSYMAV